MTTTVTPTQPPVVAMMQMIVGALWINKAIYVAAKLGIADLLVHSPRDSEDLAGATGAHPSSLHRVLRALASVGVFGSDPVAAPRDRRRRPRQLDPLMERTWTKSARRMLA